MNINEFLVWLTTGGSVVALSWFLEQFDWFQNLDEGKKRLIQMGGSAVLGLAALAATQFVPAEVLAILSPYFAVISTVFATVFLNQVAHRYDPNRW